MGSSVGHLQLSVEILWEIFSVCRKIANSCPSYFFNQRRRAAEGYTEDQATEVFTNHNSHLKFSTAGLLDSDVTGSTLYTGNSQPTMYG